MKNNRELLTFIGLSIIVIILSLFYPVIMPYGLALLIIFGVNNFYQIQRKHKIELSQQSQIYQSNLLTKSQTVDKTEMLLKTIIEHVSLGVIFLDDQAKIAIANPQSRKWLGIEFVIGEEYQKQIDHNSLFFPIFKEAFLFERPVIKVIFYGGSYFQISVSPLFKNDLFRGCTLIFSDVSNLKRLEQLQKDLIADISHELKTPISSLMGIGEILQRDDIKEQWDEVKSFIPVMNKEVQRMHQIVKDLLDLSNLGSPALNLMKSHLLLQPIVQEVLGSFRIPLEKRMLSIELDIPMGFTVLADEQKLKQILLNLISNAIRYTEQGFIKVRSYENQDETFIEVTDSGIGIAAEEQEKIFSRFYRIDKARTRDTGGSGIGLAIVKSIVDAHQGTITVQSSVNKGSTFCIRLPRKN